MMPQVNRVTINRKAFVKHGALYQAITFLHSKQQLFFRSPNAPKTEFSLLIYFYSFNIFIVVTFFVGFLVGLLVP